MEPITEQEKRAFDYGYILPLNDRLLPKYRIEPRPDEVFKQTIEDTGSKYLTNKRHYELMTQYPDVIEVILTEDPEPIPGDEDDEGTEEEADVIDADEEAVEEEDVADEPDEEEDEDPVEDDEEDEDEEDDDDEEDEPPDEYDPYTESELKAMSRPQLDDTATDLDLDYTDYSNRAKIIAAILKEQDT